MIKEHSSEHVVQFQDDLLLHASFPPYTATVQVSVEGEPHEKAVELLKAAIASVKLVVRYESSCSDTPGL